MSLLRLNLKQAAIVFNYSRLKCDVEEHKSDRDFVLKACKRDGRMLEFVLKEHQSDREIVTAALTSYSEIILKKSMINRFPSNFHRSHRTSSLTEIGDISKSHGYFKSDSPLQHVPLEFRADKDFVLSVVRGDGAALEFASAELRNDREVVLTSIRQFRFAFRFASDELRDDNQIALEAIAPYSMTDCKAINYLERVAVSLESPIIYERRFLPNCLVAVHENIQFASDQLRKSKEFIMAAIKRNCNVLEFAPEEFRADKAIVLAAVQESPVALKFASDTLNQDTDCLIAAKIWDGPHKYKKDRDTRNGSSKKIVLSTKFSLSLESSPNATQFTKLLKAHPYIQKEFVVYSPNAFSKRTCDPHWTSIDWPCRGTYESCRMDPSLKDGNPRDDCCWRYSFRYHLEDAKKRGGGQGFMIQVVDCDKDMTPRLGDGQKIEVELAAGVGTKVFRVYQPTISVDYSLGPKFERVEEFNPKHIDKLVKSITEWYDGDCEDMAVCDILNDECKRS